MTDDLTTLDHEVDVHTAAVLTEGVLSDLSSGVSQEQVLYAAIWEDGDVTLVTQDVEHPLGPDIQRSGLLTTRVDFLEWVSSTFNVATYEVGAVAEEINPAEIDFPGNYDIVVTQKDVGYHAR